MKKADDVKVAATTLRVQFSAKENRDAVGVRMKAAGWTVFDYYIMPKEQEAGRPGKAGREAMATDPRSCELRNRHLLTL